MGTLLLMAAVGVAVSIAFAIVVIQMVKQASPQIMGGFYADGSNFVTANSTGNEQYIATLKIGQKAINMQLVYVDEANQIAQVYVNQIDRTGGSTTEPYTLKVGETVGSCYRGGVKLIRINSSDTATFGLGKIPDC